MIYIQYFPMMNYLTVLLSHFVPKYMYKLPPHSYWQPRKVLKEIVVIQ